MIVMKFGGTSVGDAGRILNVAEIVLSEQKKQPVAVIISAMHKITDLLVESARFASEKNLAQAKKTLKIIHDLHKKTIHDLNLDKKSRSELISLIDQKLSALEQILKKIEKSGKITRQNLDSVLSFGERLSIHLLAAAIIKLNGKSIALEASDFILTNDDYGNASPIFSETENKIKPKISRLLDAKIIPVITGFIGATKKGNITTFGRGGSDYSATIIANCLDAQEVWIWKDVDGAMTADPKLIKDAKTIPSLSYDEAAELSYFGAKVLHPLTMVPAALKKIPIRIKNTFRPDFAGTQITEKSNHAHKFGKAISSMSSLSLITLQGKGMIGVPGVAAKLFGAIASEKINVLFISQASSEYNITFVVNQNQGDKAVQALLNAFKKELLDKRIDAVQKEDKMAIIAVIGDNMRGKPGVAGKIFSALGDANINTKAIAEGSSERNLSLVIAESDVASAVHHIHQRLILSP